MNSVSGSDWIWLPTRLAIYLRDGNSCLACGTSDNLSLDHVKPRSHGGSNKPSNLITLCTKCNRERWHRPLSEWNEGVAALARILTRRKLDRATGRRLAEEMRPARFIAKRARDRRGPAADLLGFP